MNKIPTLFVRDAEDRRYVTDQVTPGCEWVLAGEGVATRKYDGTCVMLAHNGTWWARREVRPGRAYPPNFIPLGQDETTGKSVGWEPIKQSPFARFHAEAVELFLGQPGAREPGTYELIGPKINGNPERTAQYRLVAHAGAEALDYVTPGEDDVPTDPTLLWEYLADFLSALGSDGVEGVVWHHPDGRMAKIKVRDFPPIEVPGELSILDDLAHPGRSS